MRKCARWGTFCFTVTLGCTLLLRLKTSSFHLSGNKRTTPPYNPDLTPSDFHLFLHVKKLLGGKWFDDDDDLKDAVQEWLTSHSMKRIYKNLCTATISASVMVANIWENSLKNVESDNNEIFIWNLTRFFLQRNGTYCLNKPRNSDGRCMGLSEDRVQ